MYGPDKTVLGLCRSLPEVGYQCELALIYRSFDGDPPEHPLTPVARAEGITVTQLDGRPSKLSEVIGWVRSRAADPETTVLHTHDFKSDLVGMIATRVLHRRPALVATPRHTETERLLKIWQWVERQFLDRFDRLTVPTAKAFEEFRGRPDLLARTRLATHGMEAGWSGGGPPLPDTGGAPVVSLVGRLAAVKGHEHFFAAAVRVLEKMPGVHFWLVGEGPLRQELEELARRLGIAAQVSFLGYRADTDRVLAASAVTVVASSYESSCRAAMEALHAGCPLVATPVGAIPQLVGTNQGGLLVPLGDADAMAAAILSLLNDRELAARLVAFGLTAIGATQSDRAGAVDMAAIYAEALGSMR